MSQALRILAYIHSFEPGGVERTALRLCEAWSREGAEVKVLLGRTEGAMREDAPTLEYITYSSGPWSMGRVETGWMILNLWRRVRKERPDVIYCAGNSYTVVAVALRLLLGRRCPPILAKISNALDRPDMSRPVRFLYRLWLRVQGLAIDHFVGLAEPMRAEIARAMHVPQGRVAIIDNPTVSEAQALGLAIRISDERRDGRLFLAVGRLARQKRFDLLIRAFAEGARRDDRLVIVGEGPGRRRLEALIARLGLGGRVALPGHVGSPEMWFRRCDAFVLSSDYEGLPAVIVEALAAGVAIVATDCSAAMGELLGFGRLGRLVPRGDVSELARAIAEAGRCSPDGDAAMAQALRFTVERAAPVYLRLMRGLARLGEESDRRHREIPALADAEIW